MKNFTLLFTLAFSSSLLFAQPKLLADINPGTDASISYADNAVTQVGSFVFFAATTTTYGDELWKTDGTTAGTQLVKDIYPGSTGSSLNNFYALSDSLLLFTADDGNSGLELWRSDGTEAGTFIVKNIAPGSANGIADFINNPQYYSLFNGKLYFGADNGVSGYELWSSDGTEAGTILIKDIYTNITGSFPDNFEEHNGILFFAASSSAKGVELWKTDGSSAGTILVKDIRPGGLSSAPADLRSLGNTLIFTANDGVHDRELWKTDGTELGTMLVKDIKTNSLGTFSKSGFETQPNSFENRFARIGNIAFFSAIDDLSSIELWKTDGTEAGTMQVKDASPAIGSDGYAPQNFTSLGTEVYYKFDNDTSGIELWKSDGTASGTHIVKDLTPGFLGSFGLPTYIFSHQGNLYFGADIGSNGNELLLSDGTESGTKLLANINPGSDGSFPIRFFSLGNRLLFWAYSQEAGYEPWLYTPPISLTATVTDAKCFGDSTGIIQIQAGIGAAAPFTANWSPDWVSGLEPANLPAGIYTVTVTDAEGATGSTSVTIGQPTALSFTVTTSPESGAAANGTASINVTGGSLPYSYVWNTQPMQTTSTAVNLVDGEYECTITDANGCMAIAMALVMQITRTYEKADDQVRLAFYPNPATATTYWSVSGEIAVSGRIIQASGQSVRELEGGELTHGYLNTSHLSYGSYYLVVLLKSGKSAYAHFVVVQ